MTDFAKQVRDALAAHYTVLRELGSGGMSTVYLAQDLKHGRQVAVKVVRPEFAGVLGGGRFVREIQIASKLSHPHIVPVFDSGQAGNLLYYTMPYVEGESLRSRLNRERRLPADESLRIAREIAAAVNYAHRQGVIHRDIKPENVLLSDGEAVVADFGIARAISLAGGAKLTASGFPLGTLGYMSPEQAAGSRELDARTDIYSLGCVLYEMIVGKPPERWLDTESVATGRVSGTSVEERIQLDSLPHAMEQVLVKALAQNPADRFASAEEFAAALAQPSLSVERRARSSRLWIGAFAALLMFIVVGALILRSGGRSDVDPNLLAVAPFDVLDPDFDYWGEGMVDMLSASLDGAGPLKTVPPTVAVKRWEGRADQTSAATFGDGVHAGLVVYGRLLRAGADSARALATLYDVSARRVLAEFDLRDRADRLDRLADSLAVGVMTDLGTTRTLGIWRLASFGSSSPAALKAFLQGEQHYRRFVLDSAATYYQRAIQLDSTFALAHARWSDAVGWELYEVPGRISALLKAGALNRGLARRESLLVVSDSIWGALSSFTGDSNGWSALQRLLPTLQAAVLQYPLDPHIWFKLGEARYHWGPYLGIPDGQALHAFRRAVELDSAFVPAYKHLVELTLLNEGSAQGERVLEAYLARTDSGVMADAARLTHALLDEERAARPETQLLLDSLPAPALYQSWFDLKWWPDSAEVAVCVAEAFATTVGSGGGRVPLATSLAYRGHLTAAYELVGTGAPPLYASLARLGGVPRDSAAVVFEAWLGECDLWGLFHAMRWWMQQGDVSALERATVCWESLVEEARPEEKRRLELAALSARANLALVRGDTTTALRLLGEIPDWPQCYFCYYERLTLAEVLAALGRDIEAADLLGRIPFERTFAPASEAVITALQLGRSQERLGNRDEAIRAFSFVVDAWREADPVLQPLVQEARDALTRLAGEPRVSGGL
jgi:serine/threonine-protein kinase